MRVSRGDFCNSRRNFERWPSGQPQSQVAMGKILGKFYKMNGDLAEVENENTKDTCHVVSLRFLPHGFLSLVESKMPVERLHYFGF